MIISLGSDHAGYNLKMKMIPIIEAMGHEVIDHGNNGTEDLVYFPEMAKLVCQPLVEKKADRGVMFCGTGVGASIACNKIPGIRASIIHDIHCAHQSVEHDHVNMMCVGEKIVGEWVVPELIKAFFEAEDGQDDRALTVVRMMNEMDGSLGK